MLCIPEKLSANCLNLVKYGFENGTLSEIAKIKKLITFKIHNVLSKKKLWN